ncbi:ATP-binding protein [Pedococcus sp. KACC 23699]|uniref:ATP-binding protein n=1 Tax=Pedococcus sp. KACC 23699 TaxID=3149228 RepID=A0AAU7JWY2_9MICO
MSTTTETDTRTDAASGPTRVWARALLGLALALVAAYTVWTLPGVRPRPGFDLRFDGWLNGGAYTAVALVAVVALVGTRQRRTAAATTWLVVAFLVMRAVGFDISLTTLGLGHVPTYPSWADAAWVASSVALFAALALRLRDLSRRRGSLVVLDGISVSLVALGLAVNALDGPMRTLATGAPPSAVVMNIVYPALDSALMVAGAAVLTTARSRVTRSDLVLLAGVLAVVAVDVTYFVLLAEGAWRPGTWVSALSMIGTVMVAASVTLVGQAPRRTQARARRTGELPAADLASGVLVPAAVMVMLLAVLGLTGFVIPAVWTAIACYLVGGAVALTRGLLTVRSVQVEARRVLGVASVDLHLFRSLIEASGELIGMAGASGRLIYLNPAGRRMLAVAGSDDVTSLHVSQIVPGVGPTTFGTRWPELLRRQRFAGEAEVVPVDGSPPVPVEVSTFVVPDTSEEGGTVVATIQRDISERRSNERALHDLADQRARLLHRLVKAQEEERARIAGDVHDDPVQALAAVDLRLGLLRRRLAAEAPATVSDVAMLQDIVSTATERLRNLLFDLESLPEATSLAEAVKGAAAFVFSGTDVEVRVIGETDLPVPEAERVIIHRVVKEALVNARKHAEAGVVVVELAVDAEEAVVTVDDDGRGIAEGEDGDRPGHLGLAGMRNRAQVAGASFEVGRRAEGGTRVRLGLPLSRVAASRD